MQRSYEEISNTSDVLTFVGVDLISLRADSSHTHTHTQTQRPSIAAGMVDWQRGAGGPGLVQTPSRCSRARASAICHQLQHLQIQGALDGRCHRGPLRISAGGRVGREAAPQTLITSSSLIITVWAFL